MAARRELASTDLQHVRPAAGRPSGFLVNVAHPTNVATATMNPIKTMRLLAVKSVCMGESPTRPYHGRRRWPSKLAVREG
jgi:hypothetical protein